MAPAPESLKQYFLAIVPPEPIFTEALKFKLYFKEKYKTKAALNSPPHITLHMPFRWKEKKEGEMVQALEQFSSSYHSIKLSLDNFACFPPRVIFINVVGSEPLRQFHKNLERFCKKEFNLFNANYREEAFHPHLTLAFRDLKKTVFSQAWEEFRMNEYKAEFTADRLAVLKHNGKLWEVFRELRLSNK